jgi:multiple sugar transport system substrate-binding protein
MKLAKNQIVLIGTGALVLVILVSLFFFFRRSPGGTGLLSGEITVWGVFDTPEVFRSFVSAYNAKQPNVKVNYVFKDAATYESDVINALATPNAPDVIMFHNTWLPEHNDKLQPLVPSAMNIEDYRAIFPEVVSQDFAPDGVIYAFPLYIDTLALYYNQDIFDDAGVAVPPRTWEEFIKLIPKFRVINSKTGQIETAAAAIGGSERSINRATDILGLVMLQSGAELVSTNVERPSLVSDGGIDALRFYTGFADPKNLAYTWDEAFSYSIDGFASEDIAMMFNYQHQGNFLNQKNPFLNFAVAPMLQLENAERPVNYANYWGLAVAAKSDNWQLAWRFILDSLRDPDIVRAYLKASGRSPAQRTLINEYANDPKIGVFARQALTSRSWPQIDSSLVDSSLSTAIAEVLSGRSPIQALREAERKLWAQ